MSPTIQIQGDREMRIFSATFKGIAAGLVLGIMALCAPVLLAQSPNPPTPGNSGGYDNYGNTYPIFGKQIFQTGSWSTPASCLAPGNPVVTISIATPGVITAANTCAAGQAIIFQTTSALPTGLTAGTLYYVIATGLSASSFEVSTSVGGSAVNTSGSQSGTQTAYATYTNATTSFTSAITLPPVPPGFVVPGHCVLLYQSTNASGTIELAASVSQATSTLLVLNQAHTGSGGATVADIATAVNSTTATAISSTIGGGTANTTYADNISFILNTTTAQTTPTTVQIYGESSSTSYTQSLQPGSYCVLGN
jgi:hypothetical protein